jgi:hypothetical protein
MFVQYWQITKAMEAAKATNPRTLVGTRVNYQFVCDSDDTEKGKDNGICGLFGWIYEHLNPQAGQHEPMELVIAFDTTIDEFFVTHPVQAVFAREQYAGDSTNINQAQRAKEIDDVVFGPETPKE